MDLVNMEVIHDAFGKGNVINYDDSYIKINFQSGDKRFVFPDIFKKHISFIDQRATDIVKNKIEKKKEILKEKAIILKEKKAIEDEKRKNLQRKNNMKNSKVYSKIQSVFWCDLQEEDEVFTEWKVFIGEIKSGKNKGKPRKLARMDQNSACVLTRREDGIKEKDRQILGIFMAHESFDGSKCEDGYIRAHSKYRLKLSEAESEKMLFWNYYIDQKNPDKTIWNSGRQRYLDNIWIAQILRDIVALKEDNQEKEDVQMFFEHFCKANLINKDELPNAKGVLKYN